MGFYSKCKPRGSANFRPGSNPGQETTPTENLTCPVLPIARRVTELWDAVTKAQESDAADNDVVSDQIDDLRIAVAETASFVRARSLAGALFQIALASETTERLYRELPEEKQLFNRTYLKLHRPLNLAALELRDELAPDEYAPISEVVEAYIGDLGPAMPWLDALADAAGDILARHQGEQS